jgi:hypothetical protein
MPYVAINQNEMSKTKEIPTKYVEYENGDAIPGGSRIFSDQQIERIQYLFNSQNSNTVLAI